MKNIFIKLTIITFVILIFNNCQQNMERKELNSIVENIKNKYAPDTRVAVFNVSVNEEGKNLKLVGESNLRDGVENLMNELEKLNIKVENEIKMLPDKELGEKIFGIVNLSVANIRSKNSHPAELATQALLGTIVNILKKENGWFLIQTPDGYISWVDDDGIHLVDAVDVEKWKKAEKVIILEQYSSLFEKPDNKSMKISDLVDGNILKKIGINKNFTEVEFPDGRRGFIDSKKLNDYTEWANNAIANQETIINSAYNFMGLPYLWGGTSSKGVDCSGFTKTVYFLNGVVLPRDASQQVNVGELVNTEENFNKLLPGDLLFFGSKETPERKERITHVAIYIGEGRYIHSAGRVRINSFNLEAEDFNKYRYDTFIRAKRIIGSYNNGENLVKNNTFY